MNKLTQISDLQSNNTIVPEKEMRKLLTLRAVPGTEFKDIQPHTYCAGSDQANSKELLAGRIIHEASKQNTMVSGMKAKAKSRKFSNGWRNDFFSLNYAASKQFALPVLVSVFSAVYYFEVDKVSRPALLLQDIHPLEKTKDTGCITATPMQMLMRMIKGRSRHRKVSGHWLNFSGMYNAAPCVHLEST